MNAHEPLARVLEFGAGYAASFAGLLMARCGAEVIKVESPEVDSLRPAPTADAVVARQALFEYLNQGKLSVKVDLAASAAAETLAGYWAQADVVIIDHPWLSASPVSGLLDSPGPAGVAVITPFGLAGPYATTRATGATLFAMSGESSVIPGGLGYLLFPDAPPLVPGAHLAEADAGVIAANVCLAAAISGERSSPPSLFDISIMECETSLNRWLVSHFDATGWVESRATRAYAYAGLVRCLDGYVMMQPTTDQHWTGLVRAMGDPAWADRPEWATQDGRTEGGAEISGRLAEWARGLTKAQLLETGLRHEVPIAPFLDVPEVVECEQFRSRCYFVACRPLGDVSDSREVPGLPFHIGPDRDQPDPVPAIRPRAPQLGEDTERLGEPLRA